MTDFNRTNHPYSDILALPHDFLRLDHARLAVSASQVRTMDDLKEGIAGIWGNVVLVGAADNAVRSYEDETSGRHIRRGMALGHILIADSSPKRLPSASASLAALAFSDFTDQRPTHSSIYTLARHELTRHRNSAMRYTSMDNTQAEHQHQVAAMATEHVLQAAGMYDAFTEALPRLAGTGLSEPTRPAEAAYGAAIIALGNAAQRM